MAETNSLGSTSRECHSSCPEPRSFVTLVTLAAALGAACTEGYPTEDALFANPATLTSPQLLQQLNQIGDQAHLNRRWTYALSSRCELSVSSSKIFSGQENVLVPLADSEISMRADGPDSYEVVVRPPIESQQKLIVLEGGTWADGLRMRALLEFLRFACAGA